MENPMQTMSELQNFMRTFRGNPREEVQRQIQKAGLNQQQLNELQNKANIMYSMAKQFGLI